jgi:hypothetical protein
MLLCARCRLASAIQWLGPAAQNEGKGCRDRFQRENMQFDAPLITCRKDQAPQVVRILATSKTAVKIYAGKMLVFVVAGAVVRVLVGGSLRAVGPTRCCFPMLIYASVVPAQKHGEELQPGFPCSLTFLLAIPTRSRLSAPIHGPDRLFTFVLVRSHPCT